WLLHRWTVSRWRMLRTFAAMHQVHHDFLAAETRVHPDRARANVWAHIVPEFLTTMAGTALFLPFAPLPTMLVMMRHLATLGHTLWAEGMDFHHMAKLRLDGRVPTFRVNDDYH